MAKANANALQTQPEKTPTKAPAAPLSAPPPAPAQPAPAAAVAKVPAEGTDLEPLWERFCGEANFSAEALEIEAEAIRDEIAKLEERIAEKKAELDVVVHREETAREKMTALLKLGFGEDAILSAMKVEFRAKKAAGRPKDKEAEVGEDEKAAVLDVLDREGLPLAEVVKQLGRDPKDVQRVLAVLVADGKVATQGERKGKLYKRI